MKVFCICDEGWEEEIKYIVSYFNRWKDCEGPEYGDIVTVVGSYYEKGELYYLLLEWPPTKENDGYLAECFIPLSDIDETEMVREKILQSTLNKFFMYTLKIKVTKDILERTSECDNDNLENSCAIAVAVRDFFPKALVRHDTIQPFGRFGISSLIGLPNSAEKFIEKFDDKEPKKRRKMKPFDFDINIPSCVIRRINIDEIYSLLENHPTLELVNK